MVLKHRFTLATALLLVALLLSEVAALAQTAAPSPTTGGAQLASFTLDGVNLQISSAALPSVSFTVAAPGNLNQVAVAVSRHPYREFSVLAVPYGVTPGVEAVPQAQAGGAAAYRDALLKYRLQADGTVHGGPVAHIFGAAVTSLVSHASLNLDGPVTEPTIIVEWVAEAGRRIWIVRASEGQTDGGVAPAQVSNSLNNLTVSSDNLSAPTTISFDRQAAGQAAPNLTSDRPNLPTPSWWNGDCDYNTYYYGSGGWGSYRMGAVYNGVPACGPRSIAGAPDVLIHFFSGSFGVLEWECVELSMRYLYLAYNVAPYSANGSTVVWNYSGSALSKISNGTAGSAPQPGDILSYGATNTAGHTSVVSASNVNSAGNGSITVLEQNNAAGGASTLSVSGWWVYGNAGAVSGWLHSGSGGGQSCPGLGCNGQDPVAMGCSSDAYTARSLQGTIGSKTYTVELRWSPHCQSNWAKISVNAPSSLQVQLEHTNGTAIPNTYYAMGNTYATYGNMYYAPNESVMACGAVDGYGWFCTAGGLGSGQGKH